MKTNKLRIGNWVNEVVNGVVKVEMLPNRQDISVNPIVLSENWFIRFGFEKEGNSFNPPKDIIVKCEGDIGLRYPTFFYNKRLERWMDCHTRVCIDFVHELQNLYFALMGEELELDVF